MRKVKRKEYLSGFSLIEILMVLVLIGIILTLVVPFTLSFLERQQERKQVLDIITKIGDLKKKAVSNLQLGKISLEQGALLFYLDDQIIYKIDRSESIIMEREVTFNRNGISSGGEIRLQFSKNYRIKIEEVSGNIILELGNEKQRI